ncbi:MAG: DEAD/DEAH box helicase [Janthinobacterium lividum]
MPRYSRVLSDQQTHQQSWFSFIKAKEVLVKENERPIAIKPPAADAFAGQELRVEVLPTDRLALFTQAARQLGRGEETLNWKQRILGLPWHTTVTDQDLIHLQEVAQANYVEFRPVPYLEGIIQREDNRHPEQVVARVTNALQQADLPVAWRIVKAENRGEDSSYQTDLEIMLQPIPMVASAAVAERNAVRWRNAEAAVHLTRTLWEQGLVLQRVRASLYDPVSGQLLQPLEAHSFSGLTLLAWKFGRAARTTLGICQVRYCFRTTGGRREAQQQLLEVMQARLTTAFPTVELSSQLEKSQLQFRCFISFPQRVAQSLRLQNLLDSFRPQLRELHLRLQLTGTDQLRFEMQPDQHRQQADEATRLQQMVGEEMQIGNGSGAQLLGKLSRVRYPHLTIALDEKIPAVIYPELLTRLQTAAALTPNLTGEREKIDRLATALRRMADPKHELPNPVLRLALRDATAARGVEDAAELAPGSPTWQQIEQHSFLRLNESQLATVVATQLAPDLALVQGPPGTGKSTAISQIIWHLVRRNPRTRILLASEANTAVDNALEKLEYEWHNLVKPVRVGNEKKLESEGAHYALARLQEWAADPLTTHDQPASPDVADNVLCRWLATIARRAAHRASADLPPELGATWQAVLSDPAPAVRTRVLQQYLAHVNVIGATSGALGEYKPEPAGGPVRRRPRPTRFFRQYLTIFGNPADALPPARRARRGAADPPPGISFDVVVMDEASKATPPELALALIYAKKAIIIGDHRQLPPLLDEDDFCTTLRNAGETQLAKQFSRADAETSQFERLFTQPGTQPGVVSRFDTQYRMHPDINAVIEQFYVDDRGLRCGIPVEEADQPDLTRPLSRYHGLTHPVLLSPTDHLVWVEVDEPEMLAGTSRLNLAEVRATEAVLHCLAQSQGFAEFQGHWSKPEDQEVALITFYGQQVRLLQEVAGRLGSRVPTRVQTVDKFQGMERNIVVVSLVRSDKLATSRHQLPDLEAYPDSGGYAPQASLGFAQFPNRLNVALSRAKRLLIIVGNSRHFSRQDCYRRVFETVRERGRVVAYADLLPFLPA